MVNSSPVLPHELQVQSLIGAMTTSSLRVLATTRNYSANEGGSIGPMWAASFRAVATAGGEKSQRALWSELSDRFSNAPERLLLDAIAELCIGDPVRINRNVRPGYLHGEHGVIVDLHDHAVTVRLQGPVGRFRSGELRCPPLALDKLDRPSWQPAA